MEVAYRSPVGSCRRLLVHTKINLLTLRRVYTMIGFKKVVTLKLSSPQYLQSLTTIQRNKNNPKTSHWKQNNLSLHLFLSTPLIYMSINSTCNKYFARNHCHAIKWTSWRYQYFFNICVVLRLPLNHYTAMYCRETNMSAANKYLLWTNL